MMLCCCLQVSFYYLCTNYFSMYFISALELKQKLDGSAKVFLLDIRENYERDVCSIPSHHIPMAEVCERLNELPENEEIVVMCRSGKRAEALSNMLEKDFGIQQLIVLEGGITAWAEQVDQTLEI